METHVSIWGWNIPVEGIASGCAWCFQGALRGHSDGSKVSEEGRMLKEMDDHRHIV